MPPRYRPAGRGAGSQRRCRRERRITLACANALSPSFCLMIATDRQSAFSGTKEVADALRIDAARLQDYLAAHVPGFSGPLTVQQFKGGQSNPTYLLDTSSRRYVLRRKPPGKLLPSAHAVDREFRVIGALHAQNFPVPEPILYCDDPEVAGTPFYLMAHVEGRVFWNP